MTRRRKRTKSRRGASGPALWMHPMLYRAPRSEVWGLIDLAKSGETIGRLHVSYLDSAAMYFAEVRSFVSPRIASTYIGTLLARWCPLPLAGGVIWTPTGSLDTDHDLAAEHRRWTETESESPLQLGRRVLRTTDIDCYSLQRRKEVVGLISLQRGKDPRDLRAIGCITHDVDYGAVRSVISTDLSFEMAEAMAVDIVMPNESFTETVPFERVRAPYTADTTASHIN